MSQEAPQFQVLESTSIPADHQPNDPGYIGLPQSSFIDYNKKTSKLLGVAQITIGIICIFLNTLLLAFHVGNFKAYFFGYGIWGGALFITVGVMQMVLAKRILSRILIIITMAMSIVAACAIPFVFAFNMFDIYLAWSTKMYLGFEGNDSRITYICSNEFLDSLALHHCKTVLQKNADVRLTLCSIMIVLVSVEIVLCVATSAVCCNAVCFRKSIGTAYKDDNAIAIDPNKSGQIQVELQDVPVKTLAPQNAEDSQ